MAESRTPRELKTRDDDKRPMTWQPPSTLPNPFPQDGYTFRWVRISANGQDDPMNLSAKLREGWVPCKAKDHPEVYVEGNARGEIEHGGLVLCKTPTELVEQRNAYYNSQASQQMESVDNAYMRESDPRMPLFKDRRSKVSFGSGS